MNIRLNWTQFAAVMVLSSLFWAGCATREPYYAEANARPANLLELRADTYRSDRTGLDDYAHFDSVVLTAPADSTIVEAAGTDVQFRR